MPISVDTFSSTPSLRFHDDDGGEYPAWEKRRLGEIGDCLDSTRKPINSQERSGMRGKIPYYGSTGIQDHINDYIFDEPLVLLSEDAGPFYNYMEKSIAQYIEGKSWVNNHAHVLRAKQNSRFLFYSLEHKDIREFVSSQTRGKLNQSSMVNIPISLPSLPEQKKIANFLSNLDSRIQMQSKLLALLKTEKHGYMQRIFSQELRFYDDAGNEYPDWEEKRLGEIGEIKHGYGFSPKMYSKNGKYKVITIANVKGNRFVDVSNSNSVDKLPPKIEKHQKLKIGDILISLTGNCGRVSIVNTDNLLLNQRVGLFIIKAPDKINSGYLYQKLSDGEFEEKMMLWGNGSAQKNILNRHVYRFPILLPSLPEQRKIAGFLSALDERIEINQQLLTALQQEKAAYMQRML